MWLRSEIGIRSVKHQCPLSHWSLQNLCYPAEILLAPRPAATQRTRVVDPDYAFDTARLGRGQQPEGRRIVEIEISGRPHSLCQRRRRIDPHGEDRPGDVEPGTRQGPTGTVHQSVGYRKLQVGPDLRRRANGQNGPAGVEELEQLWNRF